MIHTDACLCWQKYGTLEINKNRRVTHILHYSVRISWHIQPCYLQKNIVLLSSKASKLDALYFIGIWRHKMQNQLCSCLHKLPKTNVYALIYVSKRYTIGSNIFVSNDGLCQYTANWYIVTCSLPTHIATYILVLYFGRVVAESGKLSAAE